MQALYGQLGATVRRLRVEHGWSQDVLADRSGLHRAHIGEIERGETNVTLQTLKTLYMRRGLGLPTHGQVIGLALHCSCARRQLNLPPCCLN